MEISRENSPHRSMHNLLIDASSLISMPEVCFRLREVIAKASHSRGEIVDIIVHDPALTTRLLRIVNSAYYGLGQPVRDISHALSILGEQELNNLVIVTSIVKSMNSMKPKRAHMDIHCYWRSSIFSAVLASNLAKHCNYAEEIIEEFFISGLLLNIGKLLIYYSEPQLLEFVEKEMLDSGRPDFEIEKEQLGFDHADVGAAMAKSWNFSEHLTQSISGHHQSFSSENSKTQNIFALTGYVSDQLDFHYPRQVSLNDLDFGEDGLMDRLMLNDGKFCVIMNSSYEGYLLAFEAYCGAQI